MSINFSPNFLLAAAFENLEGEERNPNDASCTVVEERTE